MVTVIFNKDYPQRVIKVLLGISVNRTWEIANDMNNKQNLGNYDVLQFEQLEDAMNFFITESMQFNKSFNLR